jgi:hypothetical protein
MWMPEKQQKRRLYSWKGMFMACISPPGPSDTDLLAYLDGELDDQVAAHLEQCPHCRARAQDLADLQGQLTKRLYRFDCPSPAELGEHLFGLVPSDRAEAVADHISACPHCAGEVAQLEGYLADLTPDLELSPLEQAKARVRVLVARAVNAGMGVDALIQPAPSFAGLRGDEAGPLIYEADGLQIVIEVQSDPGQLDGHTLLGLVMGLGDSHQLKAHLWRAEQRIATVEVEDLGNFAIPNVAPGSYKLILSGPEEEIHIQDLEIGMS